MVFLRFEGTLIDNTQTNDAEQEQEQELEIGLLDENKIGIATQEYNEGHPDSWFFVKSIRGNQICAGAILNKTTSHDEFEAYFHDLGFTVAQGTTTEIPFQAMLRMLRFAAGRHNYIDDDDEFLEHFGLNGLKRLLNRVLGENVFEVTTKRQALRRAKKELFSETLAEELERVFSCKKVKGNYGHPIHYILETDDRIWRKNTLQTLLSSLYCQGRITSRRYSYLNINAETSLDEKDIETIFRINKGGAVAIRFEIENRDGSDIITALPTDQLLEQVCLAVRKHRYDVLTVFALSSECKECRDKLAEYLHDITFVRIRESLYYDEQAVGYLKQSALKANMTADDALLRKIDSQSGYYAHELDKIFEGWYGESLKSTVFPVYREMVPDSEKVLQPKGSAYDELTEMIGLANAKKTIRQAVDYFKAQKLFAEQGLADDRPAMHMIFTGNPGTAKTSVARLFARIMKENGLVSCGQMVEVGRADLVGRYVGWTAKIVQQKFKEAVGGVLFIDEAYSLATENGGSYGQEAIDTIVQEMENHRDDVVTIFAGYPREMEHFLETNPGLRSRIVFHVQFDDYSAEELGAIAHLIARKKGVTLSNGAAEKLRSHFEAAKLTGDFGNGRYVRNVIEKARMAQASRLMTMDPAIVTKCDLQTVLAEDIDFLEDTLVLNSKPIGRIGF